MIPVAYSLLSWDQEIWFEVDDKSISSTSQYHWSSNRQSDVVAYFCHWGRCSVMQCIHGFQFQNWCRNNVENYYDDDTCNSLLRLFICAYIRVLRNSLTHWRLSVLSLWLDSYFIWSPTSNLTSYTTFYPSSDPTSPSQLVPQVNWYPSQLVPF